MPLRMTRWFFRASGTYVRNFSYSPPQVQSKRTGRCAFAGSSANVPTGWPYAPAEPLRDCLSTYASHAPTTGLSTARMSTTHNAGPLHNRRSRSSDNNSIEGEVERWEDFSETGSSATTGWRIKTRTRDGWKGDRTHRRR